MAIDWGTIHQEYISTRISQRDLARKYGISFVTVSRHATAEDWKTDREKYQAEQLEKYQAELVKKERPKRQKSAEDEGPNEKSEILRTSMESIYLPPIDINDPIQVEKRVIEYLEFCKREDQPPEKAGMASWIKVTPHTLRRWETGECRASTHKAIIEKYVSILESYTVKLLLKGKIIPASGIFILKNQHGYRDVVDIAQVPPPPLGELQSQEELEKRIMGTVIDADFEEVNEEASQNEQE